MQANKNSGIRAIINNPVYMAFIISILMFALTVAINPKSLNKQAFGAIFSLTIMLSMASAGQTMVIIGNGIDMSVGATMSMTCILTLGLMRGRSGFEIPAFLIAAAVGALIGWINGMGSVKIGLPPMIVTLSVANVVTRLQYVITEGKPNGTAGEFFYKSMTGRFGGVLPYSIIYGIIMFMAVIYLLNRSKYGMQLFLTGTNMRAAYLSGIKTVRLKVLNYTIAGMITGIAGFLGAGYLNTPKCGAFDDYSMKSVVAVVVGGTLMSGGKGSFVGTIAGALLITVLSNFLAIFNTSPAKSNMIMGLMLIVILTAYNRAKAVRQ